MLLDVKNLTTHLGNHTTPVKAVDGLSFQIKAGETLALVGESGCGKSMTALSIMRLLPTSGRVVGGEVSFGNHDLLKLPEHKMRALRGDDIAMIFQEPATSLNPVITVGEQIMESMRIHQGKTRDQARVRCLELLDAVGIPDPVQRIDYYPHQMSGGMKQRIMIAMALAGDPKLLIADEPTTALDVTIQAQVLGVIRDLQQHSQMAIMLITHDLGIVSDIADQVAVMYAGQIIEQSPKLEFFSQPQHPYSHKLLAALPNIDKRGQGLQSIDGFVPSLESDFTRCRFMPRCHQVLPVCEQQQPGWHQTDQRQVLCHLYPEPGPVDVPASANQRHYPERTQDENTLLQVTDLKVYFPIKKGVFRHTVGHVKAVDGVSLSIQRGRTLALVGESGCGKTTVARGILQLIRPHAGSVLFNGEQLTALGGRELRDQRKALQIIFQDPYSSMNPRMLVGDIIIEGMHALGIGEGREQRLATARKLLQQVGMTADSLSKYPHEFSGGQRQRISIARALAVSPQLLICDEPTSALDVSVQAQILNLLQDLQQELGLAYLFITHNISVVSYLADEIAVMYLGRIVETGPVEQVLRHPQHPYTEALLSAVPTIDPTTRRELIRLEGDLPSPADPPQGCHFHPRCPKAMDRCKQSYPKMSKQGANRQVACFLYQ